jgi:hypothetical protein
LPPRKKLRNIFRKKNGLNTVHIAFSLLKVPRKMGGKQGTVKEFEREFCGV